MRLIAILTLCVLGAAEYATAESLTDEVARVWMQGGYTKVKEFADRRLTTNPDDLFGLILQLEYAIEHLQFGDIKRVTEHVLDLAAKIRTPEFRRLYPKFDYELRAVQKAAANYNPKTLERDRKKIGLTGKTLSFVQELRALERDGLVKDPKINRDLLR